MLNKILKEEINRQAKRTNSNPKEIANVLNELFNFSSSQLLKNLGDQNEVLDEKNLLPDEFWEELINLINQSYGDDEKAWDKELQDIKLKIICYKYFTKKDFTDIKELENTLRTEVKKYFSSLESYTSLENFRERFFNLPIKILFNFSRYILNNSEQLNKKLGISKDDLKERIAELKKERLKFINKISFISNKNVTTLDLTALKNLFDNGVFNEDNLLNRGVNEYIYKMLNHEDIEKKLKNEFNVSFVADLKSTVESSTAYLSHVSAIKNDETTEYFNEKGIQVGRKFDNEIESLKSGNTDAIIDKDSIFKEPKGRLQTVDYSWEQPAPGAEAGAEGGGGGAEGGGGTSGGGGGASYSGPAMGGETVDVDLASEGGEMPKDENGLPVDFGTPESNGIETPEAPTEEQPEEKEQK